MSEPKLISPLLDNFDMGEPISQHDGVRCCPAMERNSDKKYIVKIVSIPASQVQLDALLLTGAFPTAEAAGVYFKELADGVADEAQVLKKLSDLEGFLPYEAWQIEPMVGETGYDVYLLSEYRRTLSRHFSRSPMTHLAAVNLGLDLCAALAVSRHSGYLCIDLKPSNIYICGDSEYRIGDIGFVRLSNLKYASLPDRYRSQYTAPEISDAFSSLNMTIDVYAAGLILYQAYNDGQLPFKGAAAPAEVFPTPAYADYEMAEIILKACAPNPEDRWQDPIQMGQALVSYMQRNGANDTPIVPVPVSVPEEAPVVEATPDEIPTADSISDEPAVTASDSDEKSAEDTELETIIAEVSGLEISADFAFDRATVPEIISDDYQDVSENSVIEDTGTDETVINHQADLPIEETQERIHEEEISAADLELNSVSPDNVAELAALKLDDTEILEEVILKEIDDINPPIVTNADDIVIPEATPVVSGKAADSIDLTLLSADCSATEADSSQSNLNDLLLQIDEQTLEDPTNTIYQEDDLGNLTFLLDAAMDETLPDNDATDIEYHEVSDEVSEILSYADELIAHPAPDPVIPPDPIDVPMPEPIPIVEPVEEIPVQDNDEQDYTEQNSEDANQIAAPVAVAQEYETDQDVLVTDKNPKKSLKGWILGIIILALLAGIAFAGFYYYQNYYLQPASMELDGTENSLTVYVNTKIDESKLTVFCSDTYGNRMSSPVSNGKAEFSNLAPGSGYTVTIEVTGFHRLIGNTATAYSTPVQTNVVQISAITGPENGSVILSFTIDGPDSPQWTMLCKADDEEEKTVNFSGHMVTINGLTPGKEYTFTLCSDANVYITGNYQLLWSVSNVICAENLQITSCSDQKLTAIWQTPAGETVESWTVRCYNDRGYDETIETENTSVVFEGINHTAGYTVEVTAKNMSVSERTYIGDNAITITDFSVNSSNPTKLLLSWNTNQALASGNWIIMYSVDGMQLQAHANANSNQAEITPAIPNADYSFTLMTSNGNFVFNDTHQYSTADAPRFSNYNVTVENIEFNMCKTPDKADWDRMDLSAEDYKTEFVVGEKASFLLRMRKTYNTSYDEILRLFVIRDSTGKIVCSSTSTETWISMWYKNYCELDIPQLPGTPGKYTVDLYFNGYWVGSQGFSIVKTPTSNPTRAPI